MLRSIHNLGRALLFYLPKRTFISEAYSCDYLWNSRLDHVAFQNISARDLGLSILQKVSANEKVSSLDYDIFANKLHELDVISLDFIENIIGKYAQTQSSIDVLDSTSHAIIRSYLAFDQYERLLSLLRQRHNTSLFLDSISANLLLDRLIDNQAWDLAIGTVWELCLQEYFSPLSPNHISPLTVALSLHVCRSLFMTSLVESADLDSNQSNEDSDDVEYVFVPYVRNPNYDNFFDIQRTRLQLGFASLHLAELFNQRPDLFPQSENSVRGILQTLRLFGLVYSEQLNQLYLDLIELESADHLQAIGLSTNVLQKLMQATESVKCRTNDADVKRGEPVLPTQHELDLVIEQIKRLEDLNNSQSRDWFTFCEELVQDGIVNNSECMKNEISNVEKLYMDFHTERDRIWSGWLKKTQEIEIIADAKHTIRRLLDEEERLGYFRRSEQVLQHAWLAPRARKERRMSKMKEWRQDIIRHQTKEQNMISKEG